MVIRIRYAGKDSFFHSVGFMFVVYWAVLVFWQNVGGAELRGTWDTLIKIGLLLYFVCYYLKRTRIIGHKVTWILLLAVCLLLTAIREVKFPLSNVIAYVYPIVFLLMVYGLGDRFEITRDHLIAFCNCIIVITLYAAIYALIFHWDQFVGVLSQENAYGNELTSFFISNHEYALYLAAAIISCFICLSLPDNLSAAKKRWYTLALIILLPNFLLTYSRTALFGLAAFYLVYLFFAQDRAKKWVVVGLVAIVAILVLFPDLSSFVYRILLKENALSGRDVLLEKGIEMFQKGSIIQKLFGFGIYGTRDLFETKYEHGSVHNAYLQILLYHGVAGLLFLLAFLVSQVSACFMFMKKDRFLGTIHLGMILMASLMMLTNTAIVFTSPIDSYFLTMFMFIVPKYVRNAVNKERFACDFGDLMTTAEN